MSGLGSILSIAATAMSAQQKAADVTAHNIANVNTEGYSRQRADLETNAPLFLPDGQYGTGVHIADVERMRDTLADAAVRRETSQASGYGARRDILGQIEDVLGEPGDSGLGATFDAFWNSWSDLANDPTNGSARAVVLQQAQQVVLRFHSLDGGLTDAADNARERLTQNVKQLNDLTTQVAQLNQRIVSAEAGGRTAGDLRDARDRALDQIAAIAPIQVDEHDNGAVAVRINGMSVADGNAHHDIAVDSSGGTWTLKIVGTSSTLNDVGGTAGALLQVLNQDIPGLRSTLDGMASSLVQYVNDAHEAGVSPDGGYGLPFFDPNATTAATIGLAVTDSDQVAAGAGANVDAATHTGTYQAGNNDVALAIADLRDAAPDGPSLASRYEDMVTQLGSNVASLDRSASVYQTLADQATARRLSTSGVSIDEELTQLIQHQTAYQAAARIVGVVNDMMQTLVNMG